MKHKLKSLSRPHTTVAGLAVSTLVVCCALLTGCQWTQTAQAERHEGGWRVQLEDTGRWHIELPALPQGLQWSSCVLRNTGPSALSIADWRTASGNPVLQTSVILDPALDQASTFVIYPGEEFAFSELPGATGSQAPPKLLGVALWQLLPGSDPALFSTRDNGLRSTSTTLTLAPNGEEALVEWLLPNPFALRSCRVSFATSATSPRPCAWVRTPGEAWAMLQEQPRSDGIVFQPPSPIDAQNIGLRLSHGELANAAQLPPCTVTMMEVEREFECAGRFAMKSESSFGFDLNAYPARGQVQLELTLIPGPTP